MMTSEALLAYLSASGGVDRHEFSDADGCPDPVAARGFAERMRSDLPPALLGAVLVVQRGNMVELRLAETVPARV